MSCYFPYVGVSTADGFFLLNLRENTCTFDKTRSAYLEDAVSPHFWAIRLPGSVRVTIENRQEIYQVSTNDQRKIMGVWKEDVLLIRDRRVVEYHPLSGKFYQRKDLGVPTEILGHNGHLVVRYGEKTTLCRKDGSVIEVNHSRLCQVIGIGDDWYALGAQSAVDIVAKNRTVQIRFSGVPFLPQWIECCGEKIIGAFIMQTAGGTNKKVLIVWNGEEITGVGVVEGEVRLLSHSGVLYAVSDKTLLVWDNGLQRAVPLTSILSGKKTGRNNEATQNQKIDEMIRGENVYLDVLDSPIAPVFSLLELGSLSRWAKIIKRGGDARVKIEIHDGA